MSHPRLMFLLSKIKNGDADTVEILVNCNSVNLNEFTSSTTNPLYVAVRSRQYVIAEMLIKYGADKSPYSRFYPMHLALEENDVETFNFFKVDSRITDTYLDDRGHSLLYYAAKNNMVDMCKMLMEHGLTTRYETWNNYKMDISDQRILETYQKVTASLTEFEIDIVHVAFDAKSYDVVDFLIKSGASSVDAPFVTFICETCHKKYCYKNPMLSRAIANNDMDAVKFLLERGATVPESVMMSKKCLTHISPHDYASPFYIMAKNGNTKMAQLVMETTDYMITVANPMTIAVKENDLEMVKVLSLFGDDLATRKNFGECFTPIELSRKENKAEIVEFLEKEKEPQPKKRWWMFRAVN